jgi:hypothetical protein
MVRSSSAFDLISAKRRGLENNKCFVKATDLGCIAIRFSLNERVKEG